MNANQQRTVALQLFEYLKSPSVRHMRDPNSVHKLAVEIVNALDGVSTVWRKWATDREEVIKASAHCWIPLEDLRAFLNGLPGPSLTKTDVEQRLRAIWEEPHTVYPNEELKGSCTDLYNAEMSQGTEMRAIIGALQEHIELEEERLRLAREANWRRIKAEEQIKAERRFQSGADSGWTTVDGSSALYSRRNGRSFRISQGRDKRWTLYRIKSVDDKGEMLGVYQTRRDANKALEKIAYVPEL